MNVRPYRPSDFAEVLSLINAAAEADQTRPVSEHGLRRALMPSSTQDRFPETAVALGEDGAVAGFAWWHFANPKALRLNGWVHPLYRRSGVGTALVEAVEHYARRQGHELTIAARAYQDIPGTEALFRRQGYALVRRFYMMSVSLKDKHYNVAVPEGIVLRTFRRDDLEALVEADNEIFAEHWGSYRRTLQAWTRDMQELRPHDPSLWTVAWAGDNVVAECLCHASREGDTTEAWVSIVGVRRDWRGQGIGRAVLAYGLARLREFGFERAGLHVDAENISAVNLYRSLEMDVVRTQLHFARTLNA